MLQSYKQNWLICLVFILLFAVWDYFSRLDSATANTQIKAIVGAKAANSSVQLDQALKNKILALFSGYDLPPEVVVKAAVNTAIVKQGLSLAEQGEQRGKLSKLYLGDFSYTPLGVFKENDSARNRQEIFAVLIQQHIKTNAKKEIKVALNQSLPPYLVSNITETMIEFSADTRVIQLSLFK
tara:strand:+ start:62 stop:607 length:546 start_codon:yes stop_codon:yes gene_type:complete